MYYCSICLIIRDDQAYIREWIDYYLLIGIDHFYITDNKSNPPLREILSDYIEKGLVTYKFDTRYKPQVAVYNECIKHHKNDSTWIAFFDSDEFLVLKKHSNIKQFLNQYDNSEDPTNEKISAVCICWYLFGSNSHQEKQQLMIPSYTKRSSSSLHYKTIVRPNRVKRYGIHCVDENVSGYYSVDETKHKVFGPRAYGDKTNQSQLNHYVLRSQDDFIDKMKRGGGDDNPKPKKQDFFDTTNKQAGIDDTCIFQMLEKLGVTPTLTAIDHPKN